jgi:hypothetical protein
MSPSLTVRRIAADQGVVLRELRTASLREAPYAFGETLEDALSVDAATFDVTAVDHAVSKAATSFILYTEGHPAGLIEAHFEDTTPRRAFVCDLWVAPAVRHLRGGELLVNTASEWLAGATQTPTATPCVSTSASASARPVNTPARRAGPTSQKACWCAMFSAPRKPPPSDPASGPAGCRSFSSRAVAASAAPDWGDAFIRGAENTGSLRGRL